MRRRPRRRPPTIQEIFLGFCFCVLAVSIAWNMLPRHSFSELAEGVRRDGIKTVQFPNGAAPSGAVQAVLAEHAARTRRGKLQSVQAAPPAQSSHAEKDAASGRKWGTALFGR